MCKQSSAILFSLAALLVGGCAQTPDTSAVEAELHDITWWQQNAHANPPADANSTGFLALPVTPEPQLQPQTQLETTAPPPTADPALDPTAATDGATPTATIAPTATAAPRALTISLSEQTFVYQEAAEVVRTGAISSGKPGHATPTGRFRVQSKDRDKVSSRYTNQLGMQAWMPYAIQFNGHYFLHEGWLPGYPDSHGCVRVGEKDARFLFERLEVGDPVAVVP